ncbi:hypothetical protein [Actinomadura terrae]|uniref:hypothetical protein n=1 Tax=Actinomadura terrae TaxID=604353 RepID=UPI001FA7C390|nr:hypothetical protein [Actinomadura terrae]
MRHSLDGSALALGLDLAKAPSTRSADTSPQLMDLVEATAAATGAPLIDVGDGRRPGLGGLLRDIRRAHSRPWLIVRLTDRGGWTARRIRRAADDVRTRLDTDFLDHLLFPGGDPVAVDTARALIADGIVGSVGIWDDGPGVPDIPGIPGRDHVGSHHRRCTTLSIQADLLGFDRLRPIFLAARETGKNPVFLRWDLRIPPAAVPLLAPLEAAAKDAGMTLPALGLGLPLYTPGVTAVLLPPDDPADTLEHIRGAVNLNPDSLIMRDFIDTGILGVSRC